MIVGNVFVRIREGQNECAYDALGPRHDDDNDYDDGYACIYIYIFVWCLK